MPGKSKAKMQKIKSERMIKVNKGKPANVIGPSKQRKNSITNTAPYNIRSRKSSCPEILLYAKDLQSKTLNDLIKLVKIGEADLVSLALLGIFPLHDAVEKGLTASVTTIIESDNNLNVKKPDGTTALDVAVSSGNFECAELLIKNGVSAEKIRDGIASN